MEQIVTCLLMVKIVKFKAKDSEILATPLFLGNISKDWSVDKMKRTGLMDMFMNLMLIINSLILR